MMLPTTGQSVSARQKRRDEQMLYLMIKPDPDAAAAMDDLRRQYGLARKYIPERFHFTLVPLGDIRLMSSENLELIRSAAASLQAEPFEVTLNRISGNALVGSRMRTLRNFQHALVARLDACGVDLPGYTFDPHVSLAYEGWQQRNILVRPISWRVRQLLLINSVRGKGHDLRGSWTLEARQGSLPF